MKRFSGSYTVTITAFTEDGSAIDEPALRRFTDWQIDEGVPGLIILGTTAEFLTISDKERTQLIEVTIDQVAGRVPVLVGTMNAYTPHAVRHSKEAEALGADGLMIIPPYYYTPTDDEIFAYYRQISEAVSIPIMLYNNPVTSNVDMSAALVARLTKAFDNVRYIKEASSDVGRVYDIAQLTDGVMNVFAGSRVYEAFKLGAVGYVNPYGNYIPGPSARMFDLMVEGKMDEARAIYERMLRMDAIIAEGHPTYGHQCYSKALAGLAGCPVGDVRAPLTRFDQLGQEGRDRLAKLGEIMIELGVLKRAAAE